VNRLLTAILLSAAILSACTGAPPRKPVDPSAVPDAVPRAEPRASRGNPPFYEVFGERYVVLPTAQGYSERGVASWYGPDFHGGATSSGERYDMYAMTAAHKTLPLPAYVRVTNLQNGRSVVVRVNDRGPFSKNRIIDLSYVAAAKLDMIRDGTALVEVVAVGPGSSPEQPAAAVPPQHLFYAQAGAFADESNARRLAQQLAASGFEGVGVQGGGGAGGNLFRVRIGPFDSVTAYDRVVERMRAAGFDRVVLASE
jgi:rare lipoprotein A